MIEPLAQRTGTALFWKAVQHAGSNIIFLGRLVILARLLAPEDFGLMAIAMAAIDVLMRVTDIGMIPALVQRSELEEQHYDAAWTVGMGRALVITCGVVLGAPLIAQLFAEPRALGIIRVLAIYPLIEAAASIKVAKLTRDLDFRALALLKLPEAITNSAIAIALAPFLGTWALVAGTLAGPTVYLVLSYIWAPYHPRLHIDRGTTQSLLHYGRWIFVSGLIVAAGGAVLRLVISRRLGTAALGLYFLAARFAFLPAVLASEVFGSVTFPLYARLQSEAHKAKETFQSILTGQSSLLFPISAMMIVLAPTLVPHVLGPRWAGTVPVIQILALVNIIGLFGETVVPMLKGIGQPYKVTAIEGLQSVLIIVLVWELANHYGIVGAALAWLPTAMVSQLISARFVRQILPKPFSGLGTPMLAIILVSGTSAAVAFGITRVLSGAAGCLIAALLSLATAGLIMWALDHRYHLGLTANLLRAFPQLKRWLDLWPARG